MPAVDVGRLAPRRPEVWTYRRTAMRRSTIEGAYRFITFTPLLNFGAGALARSVVEVDRVYSDDKVVWQEQVYELARLVCERQSAERIVDFGAGAGRKFIKAFSGLDIERFQIDWDDRREAVEPAVSREASTFLTANLEDFSDLERVASRFSDTAATVFLLSDVVEHLQDPRPLLRTIRRLLRQNANSRFIISTPDRDRVDGLGSARLPDNTGHVRQWTLNEFGLAMLSAGFEIVDIGHVAQNNFDELDRTIAAELRCTDAGYERFLEVNKLPARADHLVVTTEHADAMSTGGIGTYYKNCDIAGCGPRVFLFAGAHGLPATWLDFVRSKGWVHVAQLFERATPSREDIAPLDNDDILYAVQHLVFLYDDVRLIEYQDYLGIGARIAQAKRAALLPASICVCAYAHGTHVYLDHARGEVGMVPRSADVDVRERLSLEHADIVLFPSRFLRTLYLDQQGLRVRRALHQAYPIRLLRKPVSALTRQPVDTLIFYGKQTPQKGYPEFCDAAVKLFSDPAYGSASRQIKRILLLGVSEPDQRLLDLPQVEIAHGTYPLGEVVKILVDNGPRALAVLPYKADNHPLSVFEVVDAGCQILAFDIGGVPELLPEELADHLLCAPNANALASGMARAVGLSFYDRTKLLDETWHRVNDRYTAISRDFRETMASLKLSNPREQAQKRGAVSLIVPNLNGEDRFFEDLAFGVRNSFLRPAKVHFVDDGSNTEGRDRIVRGLAKLGDVPHSLTVHSNNLGLAAARNTGLAQVETAYVCAHDNDNILLNRYLSVACSILDENPEVDAVTAWSWSFKDETLWDAQRSKWDFEYRPLGQDLGAILRSNSIGDALAVYRTEAIRAMGGWDQSSKAAWEDWQLFARMTAAGRKVWVIPEAMFLYRVRGDSMLQTYSRFAGELRLARVLPGIEAADGFSLVSTLRHARRLAGDFSRQMGEHRQSRMKAIALSARQRLSAERESDRRAELASNAAAAFQRDAIASMIRTARRQLAVEHANRLRFFLQHVSSVVLRTVRRIATFGKRGAGSGETAMQPQPGSFEYNDDRRLVELSGLFDADWYRRVYPDLRDHGGDLLDHYLQYGGREGRSPGPLFDGGFYLATYPDIAEGGMNPLVHFIRHGADEGRWPAPLPTV